MPEFKTFFVDKKNIDVVKGVFPEETVNAILEDMPVTALIAISDEMAVGFLAGVWDEYTFMLDYLFVPPEHRRQGIGKAMLRSLCSELEKKVKDVRICCEYTGLDEERETLAGFFEAEGFSSVRADYPCYYISGTGDVIPRADAVLSELKDSGIHIEMLENVSQELKEEYDLKTQVAALLRNQEQKLLFCRFFPEAEPLTYVYVREFGPGDVLDDSERIVELAGVNLPAEIPEEFFSELKRRFYSGIAYPNEEKGYASSLIWHCNNLENTHMDLTAEITWFDVTKEAAGKELIGELFRRMRAGKISNVYFEADSLKTAELSVLREAGFELAAAESRDLIVSIDELSFMNSRTKKLPSYIRNLEEIDDSLFEMAVLESAFHGHYGLLEDITVLPKRRYEQKLSSCVLTDGRVTGLLLVRRIREGRFIVELLYAQQPDRGANLLHMVMHSIRAAYSILSKDDKVILCRHNDDSTVLVNKLFPDKKGPVVTKGVYSFGNEQGISRRNA